MNRLDAVSAAAEINSLVQQTMNGDYKETGPRQRLLSAFTAVATFHHASITMLLREQQDASALALLRPLVESCYRGLWLFHEASDEGLKDFASGKRTDFPDLPGLVKVLAPRFPEGLIEPARRNYGMMCDFTHTGYAQIFHMFDATGNVTPSHPESIVVGVLRNATSTIAIHMMAYCYIFQTPEPATAIREKFNSLFGKGR